MAPLTGGAAQVGKDMVDGFIPEAARIILTPELTAGGGSGAASF
jgi:hypothetical protein